MRAQFVQFIQFGRTLRSNSLQEQSCLFFVISASSVSLFGYFVTVVQRVFVLTSQVMLLLVCGVDRGGGSARCDRSSSTARTWPCSGPSFQRFFSHLTAMYQLNASNNSDFHRRACAFDNKTILGLSKRFLWCFDVHYPRPFSAFIPVV